MIGAAALAVAASMPLYIGVDAPSQTGPPDGAGDGDCNLRGIHAAAVEANQMPDDRLIAKCGDAWSSTSANHPLKSTSA